jgi:hypothetical protein
MLGIVPQYRSTIRNYVIAFGSIFDDITVDRRDSNGTVLETLKVPLSYGPMQKYLARINYPGGNLGDTVSVILPRMSFEISSVTYDSVRKRNKLRGLRTVEATEETPTDKFVYNPVPYDINFSLSILVKNAEDGTQILEQILPFFTPSFTIPIKELEEFDLVNDTPLILNSVDVQDDYEGDWTTRRAIIWTLDFTMKGNLYGNTRDKPVITTETATTNVIGDDPNIGRYKSEDYGFGDEL